MEFLPYYLLIGVAVGFLVMLFFRQLRLVLRVFWFVGKVATIAFLILLLGWIVGFWQLPRPLAILFYGLGQLWEPFHEALMEWLRGRFR